MCIIVAKNKGLDLPSEEILKNCFNSNQHGAGFMFNHKNKVHIHKGFMTFAKFYEALQKANEKYDFKDKSVVLHFRISTSGLVDEGNCHPYPITQDKEMLRKCKHITNDVAMAHNGTIQQYNRVSKVLNDTQLFVTEVVSTFYEYDKTFYMNNRVISMLEFMAKSKLCFLTKTGEILLIGDFQEDNGVLYSNAGWQSKKSGQQSLFKENREVFSDLYLHTDKTDYDKIVDNEYENLLKKVVFLESGEVAFNKAGDQSFEKECYNHLAYDSDRNLYDIDIKNRTATLVAIEIEF